MSAHQLSAGMYFLLAKHRAERTSHPTFLHPKKTTARLTRPPLPSSCVCTGGAYPDVEREAAQCCGPVDEKLLQDMLRLAPLALHFAYCATPVEMQVRQCPGWRRKSDSGLRCVSVGVVWQCRARQQDWDLVFCHHQSTPGQPAFAIFCNQQRKVSAPVHTFLIRHALVRPCASGTCREAVLFDCVMCRRRVWWCVGRRT